MEKIWVNKKSADPVLVEKFTRELREYYTRKQVGNPIDLHPHLVRLLVQRGVTTVDEMIRYFQPSLNDLHDPFLMKDMDKAIDRIRIAIDKKEKILVYGDYDVDGTTAVALVYTFFKQFHSEIDYYIPDRYNEGYGISYKGIDYAAENGFRLVIALDCGIKAVEKIAYAKEKNVEFIICDHHRPGATIPDAVAVLDPKRTDCSYPFKELSGCGIGFKLVQAFTLKNNLPFANLETYLDLVVVSIASDIVEITGENRILAYHGLKRINSAPRPGLEAILEFSNIRKCSSMNGFFFGRELTITDLVFLIGPRINAAGRIESGKNSVKLLITSNRKDAIAIGEQINSYNTERKNLDSSATAEAIQMIGCDDFMQNSKGTVIFNAQWHKGVIGIVASRLTEHYYRPTVVLTQSGDLITGSARSVKDFDIYDAIDSCSELLEHFGGHKYAAGLSLKKENYELFREKFENAVISQLNGKILTPEIEVDDELPLNAINSKFL
ncbi:MAG: single-stranded-DNA-specific exonuclease RecJ, partial [Syntrophothermus sp.]